MSEPCRLRRGEGYGACDDEKQEKGWGSQAPPADHNRPQCGRFQGRERAFLLPAKWARWGHKPLKAPSRKKNKGVSP